MGDARYLVMLLDDCSSCAAVRSVSTKDLAPEAAKEIPLIL